MAIIESHAPGATRAVPFAVDDPRRITKERYYDREFFELEKQYLWPRVWQMACRLEEIPRAGDWVEYEICDQSIVVVRQRDDSVKAFYNVCPHRATQLCNGAGRAAGGPDHVPVPRVAVGHRWHQRIGLRRPRFRSRVSAPRGPSTARGQGRHVGCVRVDQHGSRRPSSARRARRRAPSCSTRWPSRTCACGGGRK